MKSHQRTLNVESLEDRYVLSGMWISDVTVTEGTGAFSVTVNRSSDFDGIIIGVQVVPESALPGLDFLQTGSFSGFAPDVDTAHIGFSAVPDAEVEPTESFALTVRWIDSGGQLQEAWGQVLIEDETQLPCDYVGNGDGCDVNDLDALYAGTNNSTSAVNAWLEEASSPYNKRKSLAVDRYVMGDVDLNSRVDSLDLGRLLNHFGTTESVGWAEGNLNGSDANVDIVDLGLLLNNFDYQPDVLLAANIVNDFAGDLYEHLQSEDGNVVFSPMSIATALMMTSAGAGGVTAAEFDDVLLSSFESAAGTDVHAAFGELLQHVNRTPLSPVGSWVQTANGAWVSPNFPLRTDYHDTVSTHYDAAIENLDFSDPRGAEAVIDGWISDKTAGQVEDLVKDSLGPGTQMVLANTVLLEALWKTPFEPDRTGNRNFTLANGEQVITPMMTQTFGAGGPTEDIPLVAYDSIDGHHVVELPYRGDELSMVLVVPEDQSRVGQPLTSETFSDVHEWLDGEQDLACMKLSLPRFETTVTTEMNDVLKAMGLATAFEPGVADFSNMTDGPSPFIDEVRHKTVLTVNESGTKAAAATSVEFYLCFAAGTKVQTPDGEKSIEEIQVGDLVLARSEHDVEGEARPQAVEELFHGHKEVLELTVGGQVLKPTDAHPFFVQGKGWTPAVELQVGDLLSTQTGDWVAVEDVTANGDAKPVYNFRVANDHTYFVGDQTWGFAVWTHNCYLPIEVKADRPFHFMLRDNTTSATLFMGLINDPTQLTNKIGNNNGNPNTAATSASADPDESSTPQYAFAYDPPANQASTYGFSVRNLVFSELNDDE